MAEPKKRRRPGPKPDPARAKAVVLSVRCRPEWRDWVRRYAASRGMDVSGLLDDLLLRAARADGFEMPPPR